MSELPGQMALRFAAPTLPGQGRLPGQLPGQLTLFDPLEDEDDP